MRALLVGSAEHPEFAAARRWFHKHLELTTVPGVELALEQLRSGDDPRFILLVQSRRDEISQFQIERLHRAAPLARLLGLLGSSIYYATSGAPRAAEIVSIEQTLHANVVEFGGAFLATQRSRDRCRSFRPDRRCCTIRSSYFFPPGS